jgi:hypothetical protein
MKRDALEFPSLIENPVTSDAEAIDFSGRTASTRRRYGAGDGLP